MLNPGKSSSRQLVAEALALTESIEVLMMTISPETTEAELHQLRLHSQRLQEVLDELGVGVGTKTEGQLPGIILLRLLAYRTRRFVLLWPHSITTKELVAALRD